MTHLFCQQTQSVFIGGVINVKLGTPAVLCSHAGRNVLDFRATKTHQEFRASQQ